ncbi:DnaJ domain-containing protein [Natronorubrum sediminis]|uniref:DnaJ domain-containing protein n=1 Tax=Natronorubrum sediminis TaxID=640943 RepID=A0A1H6FV23_9EURY|nr:J domain-containing protein [Natronorubrum sediminis]SEH14627.1 DnaJ domain-containing protein [Natronorubrum sediminis]
MSERLEWPAGFERTPTDDQTRNRNFDVSLSQAFDDLEAELSRLEVDSFRYSFDANQRKSDQRPYSRANPDSPAFVLRWSMSGEQYAVACDRFSRLRDNVRTVGLYVREKRKMEQRPVVTGESEFANARLPPADDEPIAAREPPHEILDVDSNASASEVRRAFREQVKDAHPDNGGSSAEFQRLTAAKEALTTEDGGSR